ncbi:MAG: hypothetical protein ACE5K2_03600 [Candidatus Zixiibacteriota bacterium]
MKMDRSTAGEERTKRHDGTYGHDDEERPWRHGHDDADAEHVAVDEAQDGKYGLEDEG